MLTPEDWELARVRAQVERTTEHFARVVYFLLFLCHVMWKGFANCNFDRKSSKSPPSLSMAAASKILRHQARDVVHQVRLNSLFVRFVDESAPEPEVESPFTEQEELDMEFLLGLTAGDIPAMEKALQNGANINHTNPGANETPLHFAACKSGPLVKWLIEHGAHPNVQAIEMNTPLHFAVRLGNVEAVRELVAAGAQLHPMNARDIVPYYYTNQEQPECPIPENVRREIQALLPNPPTTQILSNQGDIVFGCDDPKKRLKTWREISSSKKNGRGPKIAAEEAAE